MTRNAAVGTAFAEEAPAFDLELAPEVPLRASAQLLLLDPLRPHETPTEEFRTLRTRLEQMQSARSIRTVLLTSPSAGDGKSFTAANLALAEAQLADNPTLLCDFNLRRPVLHSALGVERTPGISDYLLKTADIYECVRRIGGTNLFFLPAGGHVINPLELLHSKQLASLMESLRAAFRWILLDTPPLLSASDANVLASLADGALLVTRIGKTAASAVDRAIRSLGRERILGVVANAVR